MSTIRERILAVYRGETPDVAPCMLDLSHWFYHKNRMPWDLSSPYFEPETALINYHRAAGVGFYMPNLAHTMSGHYGDDVNATVHKNADGTEITWALETPLGTIRRRRRWEEATYAWGISEWGVKTPDDLRVLGHALGSLTFESDWSHYRRWVDAVGDMGVVYLPLGYSGMGQLLNYWMGIEGTMFAAVDWPELVHETVDRINTANLRTIDLVCTSPAEVAVLGDNFSSDIQPPRFFEEWSRPYYVEAIRRLHAAGKFVAVHIDGKLAGALEMIRDAGADCGDAITPRPMGDLDAAQCRDHAGPDFILSGGVSPDLWLPGVSDDTFRRAALDWLDLRRRSPRLIANAGDQVPPGAAEHRIAMLRDLVEEHGRY